MSTTSKSSTAILATLLIDCPDLHAAISLSRVPHDTTRPLVAQRLLSVETASPMLDATVRRFLSRQHRAGSPSRRSTRTTAPLEWGAKPR